MIKLPPEYFAAPVDLTQKFDAHPTPKGVVVRTTYPPALYANFD